MAFAQPFYATLEARRGATVTDRVFEYQFERLPASQVLGAAAAKPMLVEASAHIIRDTGVKTAVRATQDVQAEAIHDRLLNTRLVDAGCLPSKLLGLTGLGSKFPPQLGHTPLSTEATQSRQNVHSKLQIIASPESDGKSRLHCSQLGRSSSMPAYGQALPPVSASPSTRNAPASIPAMFSGVSANVSTMLVAPFNS